RPLAVQDFEIGSGASLVTQNGQAEGLPHITHSILPANTDVLEFFVADQCIGYIPKSTLDGLSIGNQRLLVLRLGNPQIAPQSSSSENRLAHLGAVRPNS